jgi:hypothetical protein
LVGTLIIHGVFDVEGTNSNWAVSARVGYRTNDTCRVCRARFGPYSRRPSRKSGVIVSTPRSSKTGNLEA